MLDPLRIVMAAIVIGFMTAGVVDIFLPPSSEWLLTAFVSGFMATLVVLGLLELREN